MNILISNNYIQQMECGSNFSYILNDNAIFLSTEYKVLQSQANSCFVKCMKMMYNGKMQLFYLTKGLKSFTNMLPSMDSEMFLTVVSSLFGNIIDVKQNGFLSCQNIDISFDHVYIDPTTLKVSLVYLPLSKRMFDDTCAFENELRTRLVKLISNSTELSSQKTMRFCTDLSNGLLSLNDLQSRIKGDKGSDEISVKHRESALGTGRLYIIAMNAPMRVEIEVSKDEFTIGKKPELVDGVIMFNKMISRRHCKINRHGTQYTITDLQSANGTYVNKVRLQPNQPCPIRNGDIIRMADSDFQVSIR